MMLAAFFSTFKMIISICGKVFVAIASRDSLQEPVNAVPDCLHLCINIGVDHNTMNDDNVNELDAVKLQIFIIPQYSAKNMHSIEPITCFLWLLKEVSHCITYSFSSSCNSHVQS